MFLPATSSCMAAVTPIGWTVRQFLSTARSAGACINRSAGGCCAA